MFKTCDCVKCGKLFHFFRPTTKDNIVGTTTMKKWSHVVIIVIIVMILVMVVCHGSNEGYACAPYLNGGFGRFPSYGQNECAYFADQPLRKYNGQYVYNCTGAQYQSPQNTSPCNPTNQEMLDIATKGCSHPGWQDEWEYTPEQIAQACLQKTRYESLARYRPSDRGPYRKIDLNASPCDPQTNCPFPYMCVHNNCQLLDQSMQDWVSSSVSSLNNL